ncbi:hypothetical protein C8R45DRAFT_16036 [Mycena sanguinolenta]|nr:hypothetical protein C8R45DRAFT_16036 [Mycena sanguinolenta]
MRCLWLATVLSLFQLALAVIVNITVDDQNGGPEGIKISYQPPNSWVQGAIGGCTDCPAPAISNLAYMKTFHGSLFNQNNSKNSQSPPFATLVFFGSSVSVNCILSNELSNPVGISDMTFSLDGIQRDTFVRDPSGSSTFQPVTVFSSGPITLANHTLEIKNGAVGRGPSLIILDSISYSFDDLTSPSSSSALAASQPSSSSPDSSTPGAAKSTNTAAIAGGVIAAVAVVLLIALAFLYMRYRRNQHRSNVPLTTSLLSPLGRIGGLWQRHPKPPPDMAPVPFPSPAPRVSHRSRRPTAPATAPPAAPSSGSRISRISFNANLLVGRFNRRPRPPAIQTRQPPNTPNTRLSVTPSPLPSGNPLLRPPSAQPEPNNVVASIQQWQRRTQEETANEPIPVIHPLDMSEVDLSSHYDESSISSPPAPPPAPPPRTPQPPQRRFTVMNN